MRIWTLPHESISLGEIDAVLVGDQVTEIHRYGAKPRKVRVSMSVQPRVFFFEEVRDALASRAIVKEK